jgi:hypothetical protein
MRLYDHRILGHGQGQSEDLVKVLAERVQRLGEGAKGRLFGAFVPQIGLSINHVVLITRWSDAAAADAGAPALHERIDGCHLESRDLWEATSRPVDGETLGDPDGIYSHRWFDTREQDWPRFLELSQMAWGNFEDAHRTRVVGFWRSRTAPAPGLVRVWLMAWYENLGAWEGSRFWNAKARTGSEQAFERFRERRAITVDTAVSVVRKVI